MNIRGDCRILVEIRGNLNTSASICWYNITGLNVFVFESATLNYSKIPGEINNFKLITN